MRTELDIELLKRLGIIEDGLDDEGLTISCSKNVETVNFCIHIDSSILDTKDINITNIELDGTWMKLTGTYKLQVLQDKQEQLKKDIKKAITAVVYTPDAKPRRTFVDGSPLNKKLSLINEGVVNIMKLL